MSVPETISRPLPPSRRWTWPVLAAPKEPAPEPAPTPDHDGQGLTQSDGPPLDDAGLEAPVSDDASEAPVDPSVLAGELLDGLKASR